MDCLAFSILQHNQISKAKTMNKFTFLTFIWIATLCIGCNSNQTNNETPVIEIPVPTVASNTLSISEKCAVILNQSSAEIDSLRASYPEDVFAEIASDIGFYNAVANEDLTAIGIKVINTDKEEIIFNQANGEQTKINRKTYKHDLIFFDPEQKPLATFTADFKKDLSYFGISDRSTEFTEGYWVNMRTLDNAEKDHVFREFYKTSLVNDLTLLQIFNNGEIELEELLELQKDGSYKQANEEIFYQFNNGKDITMTQAGFVGGLIGVPENRIKE